MKLILVSIFSDDHDLASWNPRTREEVYDIITMMVAFDDVNEGTNYFSFNIATPEALRARDEYPIIATNRTIIISDYDYDVLLDEINRILEVCSRETYHECCSAMQRYFLWEYEDYVVCNDDDDNEESD